MWRVVIGLVVANTTTIAAQPLDYHGECDAQGLRERTRELVGRDPFADAETPAIAVTVTRDSELHAIVRSGDHRREISGETCDELLDATALVIAMVLAQPRSPPPMQQSDSERPLVTPERRVQGEVAGPSDVELLVGGVLGERGRFGGTFGVRMVRPSTGRAIELAFEHRAGFAVESDVARAQITQSLAHVVPCARWRGFAGCGALGLGWIRGRGENLPITRTAVSPVGVIGLRVSWEHAITARVSARAHVGAELAPGTTRFRVDEMVVWTSPRWQLWSGIVLLARIP